MPRHNFRYLMKGIPRGEALVAGQVLELQGTCLRKCSYLDRINMVDQYSIAVVEDDPMTLRTLEIGLSSNGFKVFSFSEPQSFLEYLKRDASLQCVLMDERMPTMGGLTTFAEMRARGCLAPAIMITGFATVELTLAAIDAGFSYLLQKPVDNTELLQRVTEICDEYDANISDTIRQAREQSILNSLSPREKQVLSSIANGRLNKQIATDLSVGLRTVETYRNRVLNKIGATCLVDAVAFAISVGLRRPGITGEDQDRYAS